jgi:hypothetical protein
LFGESSDVQIEEPVVPPCEDWSTMEKLAKEKKKWLGYISIHWMIINLKNIFVMPWKRSEVRALCR